MPNIRKPPPSLAQLTAKCERDPKTGCLNWRAGRNSSGYGHFWANGKQQLAHRLCYQLNFGEIPAGMCVCHTCDNPQCINPDHLFLGTNYDNVLDKLKKGRHRTIRGSARSDAKLTEADILEIRASSGVSQQKLADKYGVHQVLISKIKKGERWGHVK